MHDLGQVLCVALESLPMFFGSELLHQKIKGFCSLGPFDFKILWFCSLEMWQISWSHPQPVLPWDLKHTHSPGPKILLRNCSSELFPASETCCGMNECIPEHFDLSIVGEGWYEDRPCLLLFLEIAWRSTRQQFQQKACGSLLKQELPSSASLPVDLKSWGHSGEEWFCSSGWQKNRKWVVLPEYLWVTLCSWVRAGRHVAKRHV